jgi:transcriptional regulator with XRE-family HTH domain
MADLFSKRALHLSVQVLLGYHGGEQQELAAAAGISMASLSNYLSGRSSPPLKPLLKLARAAGVSSERLERLLESLEELCAPGDPGHRASRHLAAAQAAAVCELLATPRPTFRVLPAPRSLDEKWDFLAELPLESARAVVEETPEFQDPALCERFCAESEQLDTGHAARAVKLAEIAVCIADQVGFDGPRWEQLEATARSYRANARRLQGDPDGAEAGFQEADRFWSFASQEGSRAPGAAQMLSLRASLRQDQHRFPEAISLIDRAIERVGAGDTRALRVKRASIQQEAEQKSSEPTPRPNLSSL